MAKVTIEIVDDADGMIFCLSGDPVKDGEATDAQLLGMSLAASVKGGFYGDLVDFVAERIERITAKGEA